MDERKNKKHKSHHNKDFVDDGLDTQDIRKSIMDIRDFIKTQGASMTNESLIETLKNEYEFFSNRYPMLFNMACTAQEFDYQSLEYFLNMRDNIITDKISSEDASKQVGQEWFDKYIDVSKIQKK
ncbi:hypothetical protein [Flavobacterium sp.]|jgi:hypothetical protein|uniref:hypothetical protein n=1 Tax=Flavobacterium sp. TaxID=239 RepID=UPI0037BEDB03